jgi:putative addiction module killer protein
MGSNEYLRMALSSPSLGDIDRRIAEGQITPISRKQLTRRIPNNTLCHMNSIQTTEVFDDWLAGLKDRQAVRRVQVRIDRAEDGNFGDCEPVGEGVSEMKIHYGPGYRVYFVQRGIELVILLAGGNKATQSKDIKTALELARKI